MSVKRIWFPNIPLVGVSELDRAQRAIGIPFAVFNGHEESNLSEFYLRRYLDDPQNIDDPATPITFDAGIEDDDSLYLRRYLDDPLS